MEIKIKRLNSGNPEYTIGNLSVGDFQCNTLEDQDRFLDSSMSLKQIEKIKVYGKTAIPKGKYELIWNYSNRFKKYMPLLLNVPGYAGVRIHSGNTAADTEGCILLGYNTKKGTVTDSRNTVNKLYDIIKQNYKNEKIYLTIE